MKHHREFYRRGWRISSSSLSVTYVFTHVSEWYIDTDRVSCQWFPSEGVIRSALLAPTFRTRAHTAVEPSSFIATGIDCNRPSPSTRKPYSSRLRYLTRSYLRESDNCTLFLFPLGGPRSRGFLVIVKRFRFSAIVTPPNCLTRRTRRAFITINKFEFEF